MFLLQLFSAIYSTFWIKANLFFISLGMLFQEYLYKKEKEKNGKMTEEIDKSDKQKKY